ncbi:hypothetical protein [Flavobacterium luminosum]|uniref:Uncharacterized protein n=1 Tax=Flavobacterium luminosum TaxID=2949086 RepID=A0ABT0TKE9_9FLAO|nr:hypothetical protein [Flavobacterium sp. HXWNR70]MCL9807966.1 hypothetical protein [Flavobacterium sp. HXWNR70]
MRKIAHFLSKGTFLVFGLFFSINSFAQEQEQKEFQNPPINVETLVGDRGVSFQMIIDKKIKSIPRLGFFSVTDINSDWGVQNLQDHMTQASLTVDLFKGLKLGAGFHNTPVTGIRPSASLIYAHASEDWFFIVVPRVDLSKDANLEGLALVEYKPKISDQWRLYTRLQGVYAHTMSQDLHARSYFRARAGVSYKEFAFGLGSNVEYYGPLKHNENNFGGFVQVLLF